MDLKPVSVPLGVERWLQNALTAPGPFQDDDETLLEPSWSFEHQAIKLREREREQLCFQVEFLKKKKKNECETISQNISVKKYIYKEISELTAVLQLPLPNPPHQNSNKQIKKTNVNNKTQIHN